MDLFDIKNISPMLINPHEQEPFNSKDYLFELKFDGVRAIAYLDKNGTVLKNKRNKDITNTYPELNGIHKLVKGKCILDGEIFVMNEGRPDFSQIQKRALMANPLKIELAAKSMPAAFVAFDILYYDGLELNFKPLIERKKILNKAVKEENSFLSVSMVIEGAGENLFRLSVENHLEGIVAKRKDSKYFYGKRSKDWIKIKNMKEDDFVICGYHKDGTVATSVTLGQYNNGRLEYIGHVALGVTNEAYHKIQSAGRADSELAYEGFPVDEEEVKLNPVYVCTVKYMENSQNGSLRQPVFKGLRDDKEPEECIKR